nr:immunoglobulin light chain junction region [Macaca mulatta]
DYYCQSLDGGNSLVF